MIRRILLIPAPGDPGKLLTTGPCGARPPVVAHQEVEYADGKWCDTGWCPDFAPGGTGGLPWKNHERVLVLVWDSAVVAEGCYRACQVHGGTVRMAIRWPVPDAAQLARVCEAAGLGTAVIEEVPDVAVLV